MTEELSGELLRCPFCGDEAHIVQNDYPTPFGDHDILFAVECCRKGCYAKTAEWYPQSSAILAWNRRTPTTVPTAEGVDDVVRKLADIMAFAVINDRIAHGITSGSIEIGEYRNQIRDVLRQQDHCVLTREQFVELMVEEGGDTPGRIYDVLERMGFLNDHCAKKLSEAEAVDILMSNVYRYAGDPSQLRSDLRDAYRALQAAMQKRGM